ncbi:MAG: hypothetical protein Q4B99_07240 [Clostridia bacterium]|nr:hypothetical protein [Clostridia bacterium]
MSKTKLALDVARDLRSLADSLEALANAAAGYVPEREAAEREAPEQPTPTNQAVPARNTPQSDRRETQSNASTPTPTIVELRAFVAERSTPQNRPKIKAILTRYGVKKLTELPEEHYAAVKAEVADL